MGTILMARCGIYIIGQDMMLLAIPPAGWHHK